MQACEFWKKSAEYFEFQAGFVKHILQNKLVLLVPEIAVRINMGTFSDIRV